MDALAFVERLSRAEWISIGAVAIALAAARAAINSYRLNRDDKLVHGPTLVVHRSRTTIGITITLEIEADHSSLWCIEGVRIVSPGRTRLRAVLLGADGQGAQQGVGFGPPAKSVMLQRPGGSITVGLSPTGAAVVSVEMSSRATPHIRRRLRMSISNVH